MTVTTLPDPDTTPPERVRHLVLVSQQAAVEAVRAVRLWPTPFHNAHEALAVMQEEVHELQAHVYTNQGKRDLEEMRKEAIQVAAMAIRFIAEVCDAGRGRQ